MHVGAHPCHLPVLQCRCALEMKNVKSTRFFSIYEVKKPAAQRVHHNNDACPEGRDIPQNERRDGTVGYRLCEDCRRLDR